MGLIAFLVTVVDGMHGNTGDSNVGLAPNIYYGFNFGTGNIGLVHESLEHQVPDVSAFTGYCPILFCP
jgi:hypothetical protein